jgi:hypothetical protein
MSSHFSTIALAMAGVTIAAPSYSYPYSVGGVSLKHLVESDTWDFTFELTARSPSGKALGFTTCHTAWCVKSYNTNYPTKERPRADYMQISG